MEKPIPQIEPWFDEKEADALRDYMQSGGWVTEFTKTRDFEKLIAEYAGAKHCSVVSNGTVSLTVALIACGIGPGDEVIVPDYTMVASANAVKLAGAEVVFADVSPKTMCLTLEEVKRAISPRTKAVMLVTMNGRYPDELDELVLFCKEKELKLIEDAAQSFGSRKDGKHLGRFGDIGSFSFAIHKVITTGQGGALITDSDELIEKVRKLRDFGREKPGGDHYLTMGWNFKFTDIQAVIGIEQMKKLPSRVERKKEIYALYERELKDIPGLTLLPTNLKNTSPMFMDILVAEEKREKLIEYLKQRGIGTRAVYPALHSEPVYGRGGHYPVSEQMAKTGLWLPSSSKLTNDEVLRVCVSIRTCLSE